MDLDIENKCGSCENYRQYVKNGYYTARGTCHLKGKYKMRTESCSKYKKKGELG